MTADMTQERENLRTGTEVLGSAFNCPGRTISAPQSKWNRAHRIAVTAARRNRRSLFNPGPRDCATRLKAYPASPQPGGPHGFRRQSAWYIGDFRRSVIAGT